MAVDPTDGTLLLTETDTIMRLHAPMGASFLNNNVPRASNNHLRHDIGGSSTSMSSTADVVGPSAPRGGLPEAFAALGQMSPSAVRSSWPGPTHADSFDAMFPPVVETYAPQSSVSDDSPVSSPAASWLIARAEFADSWAPFEQLDKALVDGLTANLLR
jgi:hypothetical protein